MKKPTYEQRLKIVSLNYKLRKRRPQKRARKRCSIANKISNNHNDTSRWIREKIKDGFGFFPIYGKRIEIILPETMNFSIHYEETATYIEAIRRLTEHRIQKKKNFQLGAVRFRNLRNISSSAALVLTAELSKWDDAIRQKLKPLKDDWDPEVFQRFKSLGFFELFNSEIPKDQKTITDPDVKLVKYIKGTCGDSSKARQLKEEIVEIVGDQIEKWTFLHSGLTEAITNVSHHRCFSR